MKKQTPHSEIERLQRMIRVQEKHTEAAMIGRKKREQKILYGLKTKLNMTLKEQVKAELKSKGVQIPVTAEDRQQISTREAITLYIWQVAKKGVYFYQAIKETKTRHYE